MTSRQVIEKAASDMGLTIIRLQWSAPRVSGRHEEGGWWLETNGGSYASFNAIDLIKWMREHFVAPQETQP